MTPPLSHAHLRLLILRGSFKVDSGCDTHIRKPQRRYVRRRENGRSRRQRACSDTEYDNEWSYKLLHGNVSKRFHRLSNHKHNDSGYSTPNHEGCQHTYYYFSRRSTVPPRLLRARTRMIMIGIPFAFPSSSFIIPEAGTDVLVFLVVHCRDVTDWRM